MYSAELMSYLIKMCIYNRIEKHQKKQKVKSSESQGSERTHYQVPLGDVSKRWESGFKAVSASYPTAEGVDVSSSTPGI